MIDLAQTQRLEFGIQNFFNQPVNQTERAGADIFFFENLKKITKKNKLFFQQRFYDNKCFLGNKYLNNSLIFLYSNT